MTDSIWRLPNRARAAAAAAAAALCLTACSGQAATPSQEPAASTVSVATDAATATPKATPPPRIPAPAELQGRWRTVINDADQPVLTITDFKYTIERLGMGTGSIEVDGDQIDFFGSNLCAGRATYQWSIESGTLTLAAVGPDPCANRADAIRGRPFTRME